MTVTPSGLPKALPTSAPAGEPSSAAPIGAQPTPAARAAGAMLEQLFEPKPTNGAK